MPVHPIKLAAAVVAYVAAVIAANVLTDLFREVPVYGTPYMVTAGTYAAGFALFARDFVHRFGGWQVALAAILAAGVMSWLFASPALAVASTIAFLGAEVIDLLVFGPVRRRRGFATGVIVSNVVSAPIDTFLFLTLAGFPITFELVAGQLAGKVVWATLVPLALYLAAVKVRRMSAVPA